MTRFVAALFEFIYVLCTVYCWMLVNQANRNFPNWWHNTYLCFYQPPGGEFAHIRTSSKDIRNYTLVNSMHLKYAKNVLLRKQSHGLPFIHESLSLGNDGAWTSHNSHSVKVGKNTREQSLSWRALSGCARVTRCTCVVGVWLHDRGMEFGMARLD